MHTRRFILTMVVALAACTRGDAPPAGASVDDFGERVRAGTVADPARIVSLNPATTELLFAIGAGSRLVGRTHWDLWPDSARLVPDVGDALRPNIEAVLARHPDLVVLYASADDRAAASRLRTAGVAVVAIKTDRIAEFARAARLLGIATGEQQRAAVVVDTVERTLARVRQLTAPLSHPTVVWPVWNAPLTVIGGGSFLTELLEIAGARNVYADLPGPSPQVSLEDVLRRNPHVVLIAPAGLARIRNSPGWRALPAVREGRIRVVDSSLVFRPSARLGEAAYSLARLLHPGKVP
ncbi:MAG TPA: helical backbone metal receptor [Gemmatimonadaceae bacterium]|nr:helical backbone metal receptor [Gemmatimonadaceae bacterium]